MAAMLEDEVADALAVIDRCIDTGIAELPHLRRHAEVVIASLQLERAQVRAATEEQAPS